MIILMIELRYPRFFISIFEYGFFWISSAMEKIGPLMTSADGLSLTLIFFVSSSSSYVCEMMRSNRYWLGRMNGEQNLNKFFDPHVSDISITVSTEKGVVDKCTQTNMEAFLEDTLRLKKSIRDELESISTNEDSELMNSFKQYTKTYFKDMSWQPDYRDFLGSWSSLRRHYIFVQKCFFLKYILQSYL